MRSPKAIAEGNGKAIAEGWLTVAQGHGRDRPSGGRGVRPERSRALLYVTDHAATARRLYELINAEISAVQHHLANDFVEHEVTPASPDQAGVGDFFRMQRAAFPDLHMDVQDVSRAVRRSSPREVYGTNKGELMGMPAQARRSRLAHRHLSLRRRRPRAQHWVSSTLAMMQQMGPSRRPFRVDRRPRQPGGGCAAHPRRELSSAPFFPLMIEVTKMLVDSLVVTTL